MRPLRRIRLNVEAIEKTLETPRRDFKEKRHRRASVELPEWPGEAIEPLTREKIYEDCD